MRSAYRWPETRKETAKRSPLSYSLSAGQCACRRSGLQLGVSKLLRKEVIQPHLPVRLPCSRVPPCRHGARTISSSWSRVARTSGHRCLSSRVSPAMVPGARRVVSEGSRPGRELRNPTSLLIVRFTRRIVTVACATGSAGCFAGFPANSRVFHLLLPAGVATFLTTSPQSRIPPSTAPSQGLGHRLRVLPTFVV
jgi:hypothetical protein